MSGAAQDRQPTRNRTRTRWIVMLIAVTTGWLFYNQFHAALSLENLAQQETILRQFQSDHPWLSVSWALTVYVVITGLSLPGAAPLTMLFGWYFGFIKGLILVSFASTTGATLAFLLSRFLFRDAMQQKFGDRIQSFNESLKRQGPFFLFSLRLIPAVPFFVINAVMGLTPIRVWTFWWVSQLGMLAGTAIYVYAGSTVPALSTLSEQGIAAAFTPTQLTQILLAFALLALFPWIARGLMKIIQKRQSSGTKQNPNA